MLDGSHPARDFHNVVKPAIDDLMGREVTFDILFHNSEHQATLLRYGVKKSEQVGNSVQGVLIQNDLRTLRWSETLCVCITDREDLQAHHARLEEAV